MENSKYIINYTLNIYLKMRVYEILDVF